MTIRTHKTKVCKLTAQRNGWILEYNCTDQCGMDSDIVLDYAWNYIRESHGIVRQFIDLALAIAPKRLSFDECWYYAMRQHIAGNTDKSWIDLNHTLGDWYIIK